MSNLGKIITPIEGFQYSVNIAYDIYDDKKIKSYIPSTIAQCDKRRNREHSRSCKRKFFERVCFKIANRAKRKHNRYIYERKRCFKRYGR